MGLLWLVVQIRSHFACIHAFNCTVALFFVIEQRRPFLIEEAMRLDFEKLRSEQIVDAVEVYEKAEYAGDAG